MLSYCERPEVDGIFQSALTGDKQIIVYGSSKQGKTALVDKHLPYKDNIVVRCTPGSTLTDIYRSILRGVGVEVISEKEVGTTSDASIGLSTKFKAILPFLGGAEAGAKSDLKSGSNSTTTSVPIEFNLELPQDVSELVNRLHKQKVVVLENFHYLDEEVQKRFAFDLRTYQELGIRFVILGVWREKNRLIQFNGDLLDRITEIPVEPWKNEEFLEVAALGASKLNIIFDPRLIANLVDCAFDSIGVVQELLKEICRRHGVLETQCNETHINDLSALEAAIKVKAEEYASRHIRALESIAEGRKASKTKDGLAPLHLPFYTVRAFLNFEFNEVVAGIRRERLEKEIKDHHHRAGDVRPGDMSNLLHNFAKLQSEKSIIPPIFDYDRSTRTMRVVDSTFYFFLRNSNRMEIVHNLIDPVREQRESE